MRCNRISRPGYELPGVDKADVGIGDTCAVSPDTVRRLQELLVPLTGAQSVLERRLRSSGEAEPPCLTARRPVRATP